MPRLNIVPQLKSAQLSTLTDQLEYLNLDKVGEVSVRKCRVLCRKDSVLVAAKSVGKPQVKMYEFEFPV